MTVPVLMSHCAEVLMRVDAPPRAPPWRAKIPTKLSAKIGNLGNASCHLSLYNAPQSTCSQRVRFVLNAKNIPFAEVKLDLLAGDQLKPDYLKLNPNGVVPTLDHDGAIVIDSSVIIEYLDEIAPQPLETSRRTIRCCARKCAR